MDIPLRLRTRGPGRLEYGVPGWFRGAMGLLLAVLGGGLALEGGPPGPLGWAVLALAALGGLYEDRWVFDAGTEQVRHRAGLLPAAYTRVLPFAAIERFRLVPAGPGAAPDAGPAAGGGRSLDLRRTSLDLVLECADGRRLLLDRIPVRRAGRLREAGGRIAQACGKTLETG
ncbi:MAG: hypothetical protein ABSH53_04720 [Holophaga sp.]